MYYEIAGDLVDFAKATFEVGRELGGPEIDADVDLAKVADFFRKSSDTNFAAFQANVVKSYGEEFGASEGEMLGPLRQRRHRRGPGACRSGPFSTA